MDRRLKVEKSANTAVLSVRTSPEVIARVFNEL